MWCTDGQLTAHITVSSGILNNFFLKNVNYDLSETQNKSKIDDRHFQTDSSDLNSFGLNHSNEFEWKPVQRRSQMLIQRCRLQFSHNRWFLSIFFLQYSTHLGTSSKWNWEITFKNQSLLKHLQTWMNFKLNNIMNSHEIITRLRNVRLAYFTLFFCIAALSEMSCLTVSFQLESFYGLQKPKQNVCHSNRSHRKFVLHIACKCYRDADQRETLPNCEQRSV